jgi:hypothetical protein
LREKYCWLVADKPNEQSGCLETNRPCAQRSRWLVHSAADGCFFFTTLSRKGSSRFLSPHFWQALFSNSINFTTPANMPCGKPTRRRRLYSPHAHDAKIPGACYTIIYSSLP